MSGEVPFKEAVAVLHWIVQAPGRVRALRRFDAGTFGPLPFVVDFPASEAETEVTFEFTGGVITGLASVRVGGRFSNAHDWIGEAEGGPLDTLSDAMQAVMESSLRSATDRI